MNFDPDYRCPDCGWVGKSDEMEFEDQWVPYEKWCESVCPQCKKWQDFSDYEQVIEDD